MVGKKKKELMVSAQVYFTKSEMVEIKKRSAKELLGVSPYMRKYYVESMKLNSKS